MNDSEDAPAEVDRLVRSYLEHQFERLDTASLRSRIEVGLETSASLGEVAPSLTAVAAPVIRSAPRKLTYALVAGAAVVIAFVGGRYFGPNSASAATVLQNVRDVHSQPVDRCYQVHYAPDNRYWDGENKLLGPSHSVLWTRGDRFFAKCQIADIELAIGRDADGLLWISPSRKKGILFEGGDASLPADLATLCAINTMSLPRLVDDVLADFDFEIEQRNAANGQPTTVIFADPKPGQSHPLIAAAVIEVDGTTNAIERLVIWVQRDGRANGTVTYTWAEDSRRQDAFYAMMSHLEPDATIDVKWPDEGNVSTPGPSTPTDLPSAQDPSPAEKASR